MERGGLRGGAAGGPRRLRAHPGGGRAFEVLYSYPRYVVYHKRNAMSIVYNYTFFDYNDYIYILLDTL